MAGLFRALLAGSAALLLLSSAGAVVSLESTWKQEEASPAIGLAFEPQFTATFWLTDDTEIPEDASPKAASGVWLGNDDTHGYVLTSASFFCPDKDGKAPSVTDTTDEEFTGNEIETITPHPEFVCGGTTRDGYDLAILTLKEKVETERKPPTLYDGANEAGQTLTFIGYGKRGGGIRGVVQRFSDQKIAAGQGVVFAVLPAVDPVPDPETDAGNTMKTSFPAEQGMPNSETGEIEKPVSEFAGTASEGDRGGPAYLKFGETWFLAGIIQSDIGKIHGDDTRFVRLAANKAWIQSIFAGAAFGHETE